MDKVQLGMVGMPGAACDFHCFGRAERRIQHAAG
jgi:hypothetical protein